MRRNGDPIRTSAGQESPKVEPPRRGTLKPTIRGKANSARNPSMEGSSQIVRSAGTVSIGSGTTAAMGSWPIAKSKPLTGNGSSKGATSGEISELGK